MLSNNNNNNNNIAPGSWRDSYSGKSSPDLLRNSSSYSSQNALDTPVSEPTTPEGHFLVLPKLRTHQSTRVNIKPHIRSKPRDERSSTSIDLSRSSLELEGLGIYTNLERDIRFSQNRNSVSNHHRSISEITSVSNTNNRGESYVHPRRQFPTPLAPSLCESQRQSIDEGYFSTTNGSLLASAESPAISVPDEDSQSIRGLQTARTFSDDFSHTARPIIQRAKTEATISKTPWKRFSRQQPSSDATTHAAAVQAARIAFEEKEASKGRKAEVLRKKTQERENRRSLHLLHQSFRQPADESTRVQRRHSSAVNVGTIQRDHQPRDSIGNENIAEEGTEIESPELTRIRSQSPLGTKKNWVRFMTWSRTRFYKAKRKVSSSPSFTVNEDFIHAWSKTSK